MIPFQSSLLEALGSVFRSLRSIWEPIWSLLERSWNVLKSLWSHLGATLEPSWSHVGVSQRPQWPNVAFQPSAGAHFEGCLERNRHSQRLWANLSRGAWGFARKINPAGERDHRGGASASHAFSPLSGVGGYIYIYVSFYICNQLYDLLSFFFSFLPVLEALGGRDMEKWTPTLAS